MVGFVLFALLAALYFLPTIVAANRGHQSTAAICVLNTFLGWTFIGWLIALVWSFTGDTRANDARKIENLARLMRNRDAGN
jgi:Superinfection immunity protein